jgi:anti-sigma B factor antagonist
MATASAAFTVVLETSTGTPSLVATGELDLLTAPTLMRPAQRLLRLGGRRIYVDLRGITFVDAAGLRSLMTLRERGGERVVIMPSVAVERIVARAMAAMAPHPARAAAAAARRSPENWEEGNTGRHGRLSGGQERSSHVSPSTALSGVPSGLVGATTLAIPRDRGHADRDEPAIRGRLRALARG